MAKLFRNKTNHGASWALKASFLCDYSLRKPKEILCRFISGKSTFMASSLPQEQDWLGRIDVLFCGQVAPWLASLNLPANTRVVLMVPEFRQRGLLLDETLLRAWLSWRWPEGESHHVEFVSVKQLLENRWMQLFADDNAEPLLLGGLDSCQDQKKGEGMAFVLLSSQAGLNTCQLTCLPIQNKNQPKRLTSKRLLFKNRSYDIEQAKQYCQSINTLFHPSTAWRYHELESYGGYLGAASFVWGLALMHQAYRVCQQPIYYCFSQGDMAQIFYVNATGVNHASNR